MPGFGGHGVHCSLHISLEFPQHILRQVEPLRAEIRSVVPEACQNLEDVYIRTATLFEAADDIEDAGDGVNLIGERGGRESTEPVT